MFSSIVLYYWNNPAEMTLPMSCGFGVWAALHANTNSRNFSYWKYCFNVWGLVFVYAILSTMTNGVVSFSLLTLATTAILIQIIHAFNMKASIGDICDSVLKSTASRR